VIITNITGKTTVYAYTSTKPTGESITTYSVSISKKNADGKWDYGYIPANFKKGTVISDKQKINITSGWISFYKKDIKTFPTVFISEFETEVGDNAEVRQTSSGDFQTIEDNQNLPF
jgi:hypothetical protein